ncbi:MAG TPA: hypothetical protein VFG47_10745 [Geminicoccaceae bacterium]|nr:hypothetical protein [Geminicoccaceae bacterium]
MAAPPYNGGQWEAWFLGVGWLAWWVVVSRHLPQYYMLGLPFVAITAAPGLRAALGDDRRGLVALALVFAFAVPAMVYVRHIVRGRDDQIARVAYVHGMTDKGDYVFYGFPVNCSRLKR